MIKYITAPLLVFIISLPGCLPETEPLPQTINTYEIYYNFLTEGYGVQWEIDDVVIGSGHSYSDAKLGIAILDSVEQQVLISVRNSDSGQLLDTLSCLLFENGSYMVALLGNEEEPHLLCEPMDTRYPSIGMARLRFMHAASTMGPVDIYIGGDLPENKVLSDVDYTTVTEYLEFNELELWNGVVIAPADTLPADSTILSVTNNNFFRSGLVYLFVIAHSENSNESSYKPQVYEQPVY